MSRLFAACTLHPTSTWVCYDCLLHTPSAMHTYNIRCVHMSRTCGNRMQVTRTYYCNIHINLEAMATLGTDHEIPNRLQQCCRFKCSNIVHCLILVCNHNGLKANYNVKLMRLSHTCTVLLYLPSQSHTNKLKFVYCNTVASTAALLLTHKKLSVL